MCTPGRAQYTHLLDEDGFVVDDIIVWWVDEERFDVMPNASNTSRVVEAIGGRRRRPSTRAVIAVQGPEARQRLAAVSPEAAAVQRFNVGRFEWEGGHLPRRGHRLHGRGRRGVCRARRGGRGFWDAVLAQGVDAGRIGSARHAAPRGGTAAARPRARARASPRSRRAWAGWWVGTRGSSSAGPRRGGARQRTGAAPAGLRGRGPAAPARRRRGGTVPTGRDPDQRQLLTDAGTGDRVGPGRRRRRGCSTATR